ncbi:MAG: ATP-binding protein [Acidobacteriaceae bacterium]
MASATIADLQSKLAIASEALRKSEERATAGQLALEVMHEIRNPLEALGYLFHLTLQDADDTERVRHHMHVAEEQLAVLNDIAGGTLRLARASPNPRPIDLSVLAEAALRMHHRAIESKRAHLVKDLRGEPVAEVFAGEILQVISNLMINALDAIPENGTVCLRMRKCSGEVRIVVADNGHGIPGEIIGQVFTPFFTTKEGRGTGLGLSLSKKIIDHHKGTIRMRSSVRPGRSGTAFQISLPACA